MAVLLGFTGVPPVPLSWSSSGFLGRGGLCRLQLGGHTWRGRSRVSGRCARSESALNRGRYFWESRR